jgi:hypothetical protein
MTNSSPVLFRWSAWNLSRRSCELLQYSVASFRRAFGSNARYVIFTDEPLALSDHAKSGIEILAYDAFPNREFDDIGSVTPWRKWCPTPRFAPGTSELFVDSDVFLVSDPAELREFLCGSDSSATGYLAMQESLPERWTLGRFESRVPLDVPPVNAGVIGQRGDADIGPALRRQYEWWQQNVAVSSATPHDEQGALVALLTTVRNRLSLLPENRYRIISPRSNASVRDAAGLALVHATYPDHPAFETFRLAITGYISEGGRGAM